MPGRLQTNNRAELQACIHALSVTPVGVPLQLCVDSQLVTSGATLWLTGWIRRGWRTKQGTPVSNKDLWLELHGLLEAREEETVWIKVPSHVDIYGNEQADKLADEGVRKHGVPLQGDPGRGTKRPAEGQCLRREVAEEARMERAIAAAALRPHQDRKSTRLNSSHSSVSRMPSSA